MSEAAEAVVTNRRCPSWRHLDDTVMSNLGHRIDAIVAEQLKEEEVWANYTGWEFFGHVWWDREEPGAEHWACEVWRYHSYRETFEAATLEAIMEAVSNRYGAA